MSGNVLWTTIVLYIVHNAHGYFGFFGNFAKGIEPNFLFDPVGYHTLFQTYLNNGPYGEPNLIGGFGSYGTGLVPPFTIKKYGLKEIYTGDLFGSNYGYGSFGLSNWQGDGSYVPHESYTPYEFHEGNALPGQNGIAVVVKKTVKIIKPLVGIHKLPILHSQNGHFGGFRDHKLYEIYGNDGGNGEHFSLNEGSLGRENFIHSHHDLAFSAELLGHKLIDYKLQGLFGGTTNQLLFSPYNHYGFSGVYDFHSALHLQNLYNHKFHELLLSKDSRSLPELDATDNPLRKHLHVLYKPDSEYDAPNSEFQEIMYNQGLLGKLQLFYEMQLPFKEYEFLQKENHILENQDLQGLWNWNYPYLKYDTYQYEGIAEHDRLAHSMKHSLNIPFLSKGFHNFHGFDDDYFGPFAHHVIHNLKLILANYLHGNKNYYTGQNTPHGFMIQGQTIPSSVITNKHKHLIPVLHQAFQYWDPILGNKNRFDIQSSVFVGPIGIQGVYHDLQPTIGHSFNHDHFRPFPPYVFKYHSPIIRNTLLGFKQDDFNSIFPHGEHYNDQLIAQRLDKKEWGYFGPFVPRGFLHHIPIMRHWLQQYQDGLLLPLAPHISHVIQGYFGPFSSPLSIPPHRLHGHQYVYIDMHNIPDNHQLLGPETTNKLHDIKMGYYGPFASPISHHFKPILWKGFHGHNHYYSDTYTPHNELHGLGAAQDLRGVKLGYFGPYLSPISQYYKQIQPMGFHGQHGSDTAHGLNYVNQDNFDSRGPLISQRLDRHEHEDAKPIISNSFLFHIPTETHELPKHKHDSFTPISVKTHRYHESSVVDSFEGGNTGGIKSPISSTLDPILNKQLHRQAYSNVNLLDPDKDRIHRHTIPQDLLRNKYNYIRPLQESENYDPTDHVKGPQFSPTKHQYLESEPRIVVSGDHAPELSDRLGNKIQGLYDITYPYHDSSEKPNIIQEAVNDVYDDKAHNPELQEKEQTTIFKIPKSSIVENKYPIKGYNRDHIATEEKHPIVTYDTLQTISKLKPLHPINKYGATGKIKTFSINKQNYGGSAKKQALIVPLYVTEKSTNIEVKSFSNKKLLSNVGSPLTNGEGKRLKQDYSKSFSEKASVVIKETKIPIYGDRKPEIVSKKSHFTQNIQPLEGNLPIATSEILIPNYVQRGFGGPVHPILPTNKLNIPTVFKPFNIGSEKQSFGHLKSPVYVPINHKPGPSITPVIPETRTLGIQSIKPNTLHPIKPRISKGIIPIIAKPIKLLTVSKFDHLDPVKLAFNKPPSHKFVTPGIYIPPKPIIFAKPVILKQVKPVVLKSPQPMILEPRKPVKPINLEPGKPIFKHTKPPFLGSVKPSKSIGLEPEKSILESVSPVVVKPFVTEPMKPAVLTLSKPFTVESMKPIMKPIMPNILEPLKPHTLKSAQPIILGPVNPILKPAEPIILGPVKPVILKPAQTITSAQVMAIPKPDEPIVLGPVKRIMKPAEPVILRVKPSILNSAEPIILRPVKPILKPDEPIIVGPVKPMILNSAQPSIIDQVKPILKPNEPIILGPVKPVILKSVDPVILRPVTPMLRPTEPIVLGPVKPILKPTEPIVLDQVKPAILKSAEPINLRPLIPILKPADPIVSRPVKPILKPAEPIILGPVKPAILKSVDPVILRPAILKPTEPIVLDAVNPAILKSAEPVILRRITPILKPDEPIVLGPVKPIMKPAEPIVLDPVKPAILKSAEPVILRPEPPILKPAEPIVLGPVKPNMEPAEPIVLGPVKPITKPGEPIVLGPVKPIMRPGEPIVLGPVKPAILKSAEPVILRPENPILKPAEPIVLGPVKPIMEPAEPIVLGPVKPIMKPAEPIVLGPVKPIMKPAEPIVLGPVKPAILKSAEPVILRPVTHILKPAEPIVLGPVKPIMRPAEPIILGPVKPAIFKSVQPINLGHEKSFIKPDVPVIVEPLKPVILKSAQPNIVEPMKPILKPDEPVILQTLKSAFLKPIKPVIVEPIKPIMLKPVKYVSLKPIEPAKSMKKVLLEPVKPVFLKAIKPITVEPVRPVIFKPVEQTHLKPINPFLFHKVKHEIMKDVISNLFNGLEPPKPVILKPLQPIHHGSIRTVTSESMKPALTTPLRHSVLEPIHPAILNPVKPITTLEPGILKPLEPLNGMPKKPVSFNSAKPAILTPMNPIILQPMKPTIFKSNKPLMLDPVEPVILKPLKASYDKPFKPTILEPVKPFLKPSIGQPIIFPPREPLVSKPIKSFIKPVIVTNHKPFNLKSLNLPILLPHKSITGEPLNTPLKKSVKHTGIVKEGLKPVIREKSIIIESQQFQNKKVQSTYKTGPRIHKIEAPIINKNIIHTEPLVPLNQIVHHKRDPILEFPIEPPIKEKIGIILGKIKPTIPIMVKPLVQQKSFLNAPNSYINKNVDTSSATNPLPKQSSPKILGNEMKTPLIVSPVKQFKALPTKALSGEELDPSINEDFSHYSQPFMEQAYDYDINEPSKQATTGNVHEIEPKTIGKPYVIESESFSNKNAEALTDQGSEIQDQDDPFYINRPIGIEQEKSVKDTPSKHARDVYLKTEIPTPDNLAVVGHPKPKIGHSFNDLPLKTAMGASVIHDEQAVIKSNVNIAKVTKPKVYEKSYIVQSESFGSRKVESTAETGYKFGMHGPTILSPKNPVEYSNHVSLNSLSPIKKYGITHEYPKPFVSQKSVLIAPIIPSTIYPSKSIPVLQPLSFKQKLIEPTVNIKPFKPTPIQLKPSLIPPNFHPVKHFPFPFKAPITSSFIPVSSGQKIIPREVVGTIKHFTVKQPEPSVPKTSFAFETRSGPGMQPDIGIQKLHTNLPTKHINVIPSKPRLPVPYISRSLTHNKPSIPSQPIISQAGPFVAHEISLKPALNLKPVSIIHNKPDVYEITNILPARKFSNKKVPSTGDSGLKLLTPGRLDPLIKVPEKPLFSIHLTKQPVIPHNLADSGPLKFPIAVPVKSFSVGSVPVYTSATKKIVKPLSVQDIKPKVLEKTFVVESQRFMNRKVESTSGTGTLPLIPMNTLTKSIGKHIFSQPLTPIGPLHSSVVPRHNKNVPIIPIPNKPIGDLPLTPIQHNAIGHPKTVVPLQAPLTKRVGPQPLLVLSKPMAVHSIELKRPENVKSLELDKPTTVKQIKPLVQEKTYLIETKSFSNKKIESTVGSGPFEKGVKSLEIVNPFVTKPEIFIRDKLNYIAPFKHLGHLQGDDEDDDIKDLRPLFPIKHTGVEPKGHSVFGLPELPPVNHEVNKPVEIKQVKPIVHKKSFIIKSHEFNNKRVESSFGNDNERLKPIFGFPIKHALPSKSIVPITHNIMNHPKEILSSKPPIGLPVGTHTIPEPRTLNSASIVKLDAIKQIKPIISEKSFIKKAESFNTKIIQSTMTTDKKTLTPGPIKPLIDMPIKQINSVSVKPVILVPDDVKPIRHSKISIHAKPLLYVQSGSPVNGLPKTLPVKTLTPVFIKENKPTIHEKHFLIEPKSIRSNKVESTFDTSNKANGHRHLQPIISSIPKDISTIASKTNLPTDSLLEVGSKHLTYGQIKPPVGPFRHIGDESIGIVPFNSPYNVPAKPKLSFSHSIIKPELSSMNGLKKSDSSISIVKPSAIKAIKPTVHDKSVVIVSDSFSNRKIESTFNTGPSKLVHAAVKPHVPLVAVSSVPLKPIPIEVAPALSGNQKPIIPIRPMVIAPLRPTPFIGHPQSISLDPKQVTGTKRNLEKEIRPSVQEKSVIIESKSFSEKKVESSVRTGDKSSILGSDKPHSIGPVKHFSTSPLKPIVPIQDIGTGQYTYSRPSIPLKLPERTQIIHKTHLPVKPTLSLPNNQDITGHSKGILSKKVNFPFDGSLKSSPLITVNIRKDAIEPQKHSRFEDFHQSLFNPLKKVGNGIIIPAGKGISHIEEAKTLRDFQAISNSGSSLPKNKEDKKRFTVDRVKHFDVGVKKVKTPIPFSATKELPNLKDSFEVEDLHSKNFFDSAIPYNFGNENYYDHNEGKEDEIEGNKQHNKGSRKFTVLGSTTAQAVRHKKAAHFELHGISQGGDKRVLSLDGINPYSNIDKKGAAYLKSQDIPGKLNSYHTYHQNHPSYGGSFHNIYGYGHGGEYSLDEGNPHSFLEKKATGLEGKSVIGGKKTIFIQETMPQGFGRKTKIIMKSKPQHMTDKKAIVYHIEKRYGMDDKKGIAIDSIKSFNTGLDLDTLPFEEKNSKLDSLRDYVYGFKRLGVGDFYSKKGSYTGGKSYILEDKSGTGGDASDMKSYNYGKKFSYKSELADDIKPLKLDEGTSVATSSKYGFSRGRNYNVEKGLVRSLRIGIEI